MEEQNVVDSAPVEEGKTSAEILEAIEQAKGKLEAQGNAKPEAVEPTEPPQEISPVEPETTDKPVESQVTSEPEQVVPAPGEPDKAGDDVDEWMKVKGFKSIQDMARSLRNLERKLHSREKTKANEVPAYVPPVAPPPPTYQRPMQPPNSGLNEIADLYQIPAEDIKRIAPLINDLADFQMRQRMQPLVSELTELKKVYQKDSEFKRLESDPLFQDREVLKEMHELAEADPSILERPDYPKVLFDESLKRIGRRFVEGSKTGEYAPGDQRLGITRRPPPAGRGSVGGPKGIPVRPPSSMTVDSFAKLPLAEQKKYLARHGAIKPSLD